MRVTVAFNSRGSTLGAICRYHFGFESLDESIIRGLADMGERE
jgi:hypothetical protein